MIKNSTHMWYQLNLNSLIHSKFKCLENEWRKQRPKYQLTWLSSIHLHNSAFNWGETNISTEFKHQVKIKNRMNNVWVCVWFYHLCTNFTIKEIEIRMSSDNLTWWVFTLFCVHTIIFGYFFLLFRFVSDLSASAPESTQKATWSADWSTATAKERERKGKPHTKQATAHQQNTHRKQNSTVLQQTHLHFQVDCNWKRRKKKN